MSQWVITCLKPLAFAGLGFFLLSTSAQAHEVTPPRLELYVGEVETVTIKDNSGCSAVIGGEIYDTSIAELLEWSPINEEGKPEGSEVTVKVRASQLKGGETTLEINWVGEDAYYGGTGSCLEDSQKDGNPAYVTVVVLDPKAESLSSSGRALQSFNTFTGEFTLRENYDLYLDGPLPVYFQRYYASHLERGDIVGEMGPNWLHNYNWRLANDGDFMVIVSPRGEVYRYEQDSGSGSWNRSGGNGQRPLQLVFDGADIVVFDPIDSLRYHFDINERLSLIADGRGNELTLSYSDGSSYPVEAKGKLESIVDGLGRGLRINYWPVDDRALIDSVIESAGLASPNLREVKYGYGGNQYQEIATARAVSEGQASEPTAPPRSVQYTNLSTVSLPAEDYYSEGYGQAMYPVSYSYADPANSGFSGLLAAKTQPYYNTPFSQTYYGALDGEALAGRLRSQMNHREDVFNITYSTDGLQTTVTGPDSNSLLHRHNTQGVLVEQSGASALALTFAADSLKRHSTVTNSAGHSTTLSYSTVHGKLEQVIDRNGNTTSFTYAPRTGAFDETHYDLMQIRFPDGTTRQFNYDSVGNLTGTTNQVGATWQYTYNARGQRLTATNPDGATTRFTYNGDGTLATRVDANNNVTAFSYDQHKRLARVDWPDGGYQAFVYTATDLLQRVSDQSGYGAYFNYDANGNLSSISGQDVTYASFYYNGNDLLESVYGPDGSFHTRSYNNRLGLASIRFDSAGEVYATEVSGSVFDFGYDAAGRPVEAITPLGHRWLSAYDAVGNLISATSPEGNIYQYGHDALGQVISVITPENTTTQYSYDALGRVTAVTDPLGNRVDYTYDPLGRVAEITLPGGIAAKFQRDSQGRLTELVDPTGNSWKSDYLPAGPLGKRKDPIGREESYSYDALGRLDTITYPDGSSQQLRYQGRDLIVAREFQGGETIIEYNYNSFGQLTGGDGISLAYDSLGRIAQSNGVLMTYHGSGAVASVDFGDGKVVYYSYGADGALESITDWLDGTTTFQRNTDGRPTRISYPNGVAELRTYNKNGDIVGLRYEHGTEARIDIQYSRDASGQIVGQTQIHPLAFIPGDEARAQSVDAAQQIVGFSYDARGRVLDDGRHRFSWDDASRVTQLNVASQVINFQYDAFGGVLSRQGGGQFTQYVWNYGFSRLPVISKTLRNETEPRYYIHSPEGFLLYSIDAQGQRQVYHYDVQGNTVALTNDSGDVTDSFQYSPFGDILARQGVSDTPFTFGGRFGVMQESAGLYRMYQRLYDVQSMRFISPEPVAGRLHPHAINPYNFAAMNPLMYQAPLGVGTTVAAALEESFGSAVAGTGAAGLRAHLIERAAAGADQLADMLSNALPADAPPRDATPASFAVENARRLQGLATGLSALDLGTAPLQLAGVGHHAYKLKTASNNGELPVSKRLRLAFEHTVVAQQANWNAYRAGEISRQRYEELSRTRWLDRHHSHVQRIEQALNGELLRAGIERRVDTWLQPMLGVQNLFEPDIPIPQQRWPQMLSPENNYRGVR